MVQAKRTRKIEWLLLIVCMMLLLPVMAGGDSQEEMEYTRKEMYRLYSTDSLERFMEVGHRQG